MSTTSSFALALVLLLGMLTGGSCRVIGGPLAGTNAGDRGASCSGSGRTSGLVRSRAGVAQSDAADVSATAKRGRHLFEPPRSERSRDVKDHEAADVCLAFAAGACSCF